MSNAQDDFEDLPAPTSTGPVAEPDLSGFDNDFGAAKVQERKGRVPDGTYSVSIERFEITTTKPKDEAKKPQPLLKFMLRCLEPRGGAVIFRDNVVTPKTLAFIKTDLHLCGVKIEKLSELSARKAELINVKLQVQVKTTKAMVNGKEVENVNVYFNKRLDDDTPVGGDGFAEF